MRLRGTVCWHYASRAWKKFGCNAWGVGIGWPSTSSVTSLTEDDLRIAYQHVCVLRLRKFARISIGITVLTMVGALLMGEHRRVLWLVPIFVFCLSVANDWFPTARPVFLPSGISRLLGVVMVDILNILDICASAAALLADPVYFVSGGGFILMATNRLIFGICSTSYVSAAMCGLQLITVPYCLATCRGAVATGEQEQRQEMLLVQPSILMMNLSIAFLTVALSNSTYEVLAKSMLRNEDMLNLLEHMYVSALQRLKTPLLLAKSDMKALESRDPAMRIAQQRIGELWDMLTSLEGVSNTNAASLCDAKRSRDHLPRLRRRTSASPWAKHSHASAPLAGIPESDLDGSGDDDAPASAASWPMCAKREMFHSSTGASYRDGFEASNFVDVRALSDESKPSQGCTDSVTDEAKSQWQQSRVVAAANKTHGVVLKPIVTHVIEVMRHIPLDAADLSREVLFEASMQVLQAPLPKTWDPCVAWTCNLCGCRNDEEDEFCGICFCERGMQQSSEDEEDGTSDWQSDEEERMKQVQSDEALQDEQYASPGLGTPCTLPKDWKQHVHGYEDQEEGEVKSTPSDIHNAPGNSTPGEESSEEKGLRLRQHSILS